ncbi:HEAT repeat domain-containing protein [Catellatospora bangladeshensis]|nr:HEAT repeat domain-containing protein [Catellatospora bangladeshensis]
MLETLDDVAWDRLSHAYGPAGDVPALIKLLTSADAETRDQARYGLYGNIFHQGTRYEASAHAVPFLVELTLEPSIPDRAEIVLLLTGLAIGYPHDYMVSPFPVAELRSAVGGFGATWRADASARYLWWVKDIENRQPPNEVERQIANALDELRVYEAVRDAVPQPLTLLTDTDEELAGAVTRALAWFPEQASQTVPALTAVAADEAQGSGMRATALLAAGMAGRDACPLSNLLARLIHDYDENLRWAAAGTWALTAGPDAPDTAKSVLRLFGEPAEDDEPHWLRWAWSRADWSLALLEVVDEVTAAQVRRQRVAVALEERWDEGSLWHNRLVTPFQLAYPDGEPDEPVPFAKLTPAQRCLVEFLLSHPEALEGDPEGGGYLLREHCLPDEHPALAAYAAS